MTHLTRVAGSAAAVFHAQHFGLLALHNSACLHAQNDQLEKAVQVWKDGLAKGRNVVGGDKPVTVTNIAVGLRNLGRYEESLEFYQQAAALRPNEPRVINGLRNVKEIMGLD